MEKDCPDEVYKFGKQVAKAMNDNGMYMLDIADSKKGLKVLETNPFSTSALYACDVDKIIDAIYTWLWE